MLVQFRQHTHAHTHTAHTHTHTHCIYLYIQFGGYISQDNLTVTSHYIMTSCRLIEFNVATADVIRAGDVTLLLGNAVK